MNQAFLGTQPAKLRMLRKLLRDRPEIRHQLFNLSANQLLAQPLDRLANQLVPQTKRKHDTRAECFALGTKQCRSKPVLCSRGHPVAPPPLFYPEPYVACFQ